MFFTIITLVKNSMPYLEKNIISVSPLNYDLTNQKILNELKDS